MSGDQWYSLLKLLVIVVGIVVLAAIIYLGD